MANFTTDVLQSIDNTNLYKGISFKYDNYKTDKLRFIPEPKRIVKTKTIQLPLLEFNPQYNTINSTIADANLALQIKENYENVNYVPITSSGYRGFSSLNSRRNGVKEGFNDKLLKQMSNYRYPPAPPQPQTPIKKEQIRVRTPISTPQEFSNESDSSRKSNYGSDIFNAIMNDKNKTPTRKNSQSGSSTDSIGNAIWDAMMKDRSNTPYVPPNKRPLAKLKKEAKKAETQQRKESTPGPYSGPRKGKGVGKMPSASNYMSKKDSDEEMNS